MDYILEQVKEKGIVKYIQSYKEDFDRVEHYKKCMKEIINIDYKILTIDTDVDYNTFYYSFKTIKGIQVTNINNSDNLWVVKYEGDTMISQARYKYR